MAKTSRERVAAHRHKIYADPERHVLMKATDRIRKQQQRNEIREKGGSLTVTMRKRATEYQRKWREKQRKLKQSLEMTHSEESGACALNFTPQSIGKATRKVERVLPKSPRKKAAVVGKLLAKVSPKKAKLIVKLSMMPRKSTGDRKQRSDAMNAEEVAQIKNFFKRDDISRMCPGKKDFVSVKTDNGREHRQKRVLNFNLREVHQMFTAEYDIKVGFSKFCAERPEEVVLTGERGQEVCQCEYHENVDMCLEGLRKVVGSLPKTARRAVELTVCSMENQKCVDRECNDCGTGKLDSHFDEIDDETEVSYRKWTKGGLIRKALIETDISEAKADLYAQMETFARHVYNTKRQHRELTYLKDNLSEGKIIVQEDFAENYTLRQQNEIMAAHWAPEQVTVFTAVVYYRNGNTLENVSYAVVSNELEHNKQSVYMCNKMIIDTVSKQLGFKVEHVYYWTDGCGAQFKNKYTLSNLLYHMRDFGCTAEWNFFETAHGKGPVDGIGASLKRCVWRCTMQGRECPTDAKTFFEVAKREAKSINILYADKEDITKTITELGIDDRWAVSKAIPGTRRFHHFRPASGSDGNELLCSVNSSYSVSTVPCGSKEVTNNDSSYISGDYIVAAFQTKKSFRHFVGQVCINSIFALFFIYVILFDGVRNVRLADSLQITV